MPSQRTIFLTGASGVVGQALIEKMDPRSVICLVRQTPVSHLDVMTVQGDISLPRFGSPINFVPADLIWQSICKGCCAVD